MSWMRLLAAVFPYPRKAEMAGTSTVWVSALAQSNTISSTGTFEQRPGCYKAVLRHFGVSGAMVRQRVSRWSGDARSIPLIR